MKAKKTSIKLNIRIKEKMTLDGVYRWRKAKRGRLTKFTWKPYASSARDLKKFFPPDGSVPVHYLQSDPDIQKFIFKCLAVDKGMVLALQGWGHKKCKGGIGFTKHLCEIQILNVEDQIAKVSKTRKLNNYWFRKEYNKQKRLMWR